VVTPVMVALGALVGLGVVLVLVGLSSRETPARKRVSPALRQGQIRRATIAALAAVLTLVWTRWPVAALLAAAAVYALRGFASSPASAVISRLEAIATWTEMLRDTLAAAAGLSQALVGTAAVAPEPIRAEVQTLATRISAGVPPRDALISLADSLGDQSGDVIVAALLMAVENRAQRLSDLLGALAATTREQVAMRLRVEASRASARTALRTVAGFSVCFLALMAVFARSYLAPFGTATGQLVMAVIGALFACGLWLMARMARPAPSPRLGLAGDAAS
jgi:tight adherence protein B